MRHENGIVPIAPKAREFRLNGFREKEISLNSDFVYQSLEAKQMAETTKGEFYSLLAVLINAVSGDIDSIREKSPFGLKLHKKQYEKQSRQFDSPEKYPFPRGMVSEVMPPLTFNELKNRMEITVGSIVMAQIHNLQRQARKIEDSQISPLVSVYTRYEEHIAFLDRNLEHNISPERIILNGVGTSVNSMTNILQVIPEVLNDSIAEKSSLNSDFMLETARNSYPLIVSLAMGSIWAFPDFDMYLQNGEMLKGDYAKEHFILEEIKGKFRLGLSPDAISKYHEIYGKKINLNPNITSTIARCPAMVNFQDTDKKNAVSKLWDWHIDMAKPIYNQQNFRSNSHRWY